MVVFVVDAEATDEDIVDDSLASDLDVNEMNLTDDEDMDHEEIYGLFNIYKDKDDLAIIKPRHTNK